MFQQEPKIIDAKIRNDVSKNATIVTPRLRSVFHCPDETYLGFFSRQWSSICDALGVSGVNSKAACLQAVSLMDPWGWNKIGVKPRYRSYVSQDGFPFELSISWHGGEPEIRILFESQGPEPTALSSLQASQALTRRLASIPDVDVNLDGCLAIEPLFITNGRVGDHHPIWHSLAWRPGTKPHYKVYFGPPVQTANFEESTVRSAMSILGLAEAWAPISERYAILSAQGHRIEFFALDLQDQDHGRAKVYFRHSPMPRENLCALAAFAHHYDPLRFGRILTNVYQHQCIVSNEPMTCLAFRRGKDAAVESNLYLRLSNVVPSDAHAAQIIASILADEGADADAYMHMLTKVAPRPLEQTTGLQELLSYRTLSADRPADVGVSARVSHAPSIQ
ncbi:tryptophan dimethylallyltransferase family protein [Ensifer adhaerens]|uniref:tryptophan dimethylallyltransferase family protein n=1 Tax=Ensifer adhaerens TaxID=106592 RepID=UPI00384C9F0D